MILTLDTIGERYKLLPSEVLARGSTLDLFVMDAALSYHNYQQKKQNGQVAENYTQDELLAMIKKANDGEPS